MENEIAELLSMAVREEQLGGDGARFLASPAVTVGGKLGLSLSYAKIITKSLNLSSTPI